MFCGMVNDPTWITIANLIFLGLFSLSFVFGIFAKSLSGLFSDVLAGSATLGAMVFTIANFVFMAWMKWGSMCPNWVRWASLACTIGCCGTYILVCTQGNGAIVCNAVETYVTFCNDSWMKYIFYILYFICGALQFLHWYAIGNGGAGGFSHSLGTRMRSSSRGQRRAGGPGGYGGYGNEVWTSGSDEEDSQDEEEKVGTRSGRGQQPQQKRGIMGMGGAGSSGDEEQAYAPVRTSGGGGGGGAGRSQNRTLRSGYAGGGGAGYSQEEEEGMEMTPRMQRRSSMSSQRGM